jgi:hypothetical protein
MTAAQAQRSKWVLAALAAFAMAWAILRAALQSITIDEAVTHNVFVFNHRFLRYAANNHILNSILMYGSTKLFGVSQFTARLPALVGAALYIAAVYRLCGLLGQSLFVRATVFVCMVVNPFIFDHLVAARGYGLALAFLMWAIVYFAEARFEERYLVFACAVSSACAGLSVDANLSFAFVAAVTMSAILFSAWRGRPDEGIHVAAACVVPGLALLAMVSGYALLHRHSNELIYGSQSLSETFGSIIEASLFQNRFVFLRPLVFPLVGATGAAWLAAVVAMRRKSNAVSLGGLAVTAFVFTLAVHWLAFRLFGLLLPKDRTAIYFFPLFMIAAGSLAAVPAPSTLTRYLRGAFLASLAFMGIYFLLCLRLTYFKEWFWDADVQKTYAVLTCLNREYQVRQVASTWSYEAPLNFYRLARPTSIAEISQKFDPASTEVYVVDSFHTPEALDGKNLKIFYRSATTDLVLAADPMRAETYVSGTCLRLYRK